MNINDLRKQFSAAPKVLPERKPKDCVACDDVGFVRYNGGERCDMLSGPCSCKAWHNIYQERELYESFCECEAGWKLKETYSGHCRQCFDMYPKEHERDNNNFCSDVCERRYNKELGGERED